ncbi:MAG: bifunctional histidinol-phosphatase/imidazoleglycerol-phosphate dehydratase HisB [Bacteroidota bacterium]|nr:bifunctional histidinol-phosphatase/imidazoleglycerol-phosphate dehydratase HisB [Candidatus Kapabacteria bacterium]MDW8220361.1 bifunctional histidinol-phosphatase/imidazoleglycerol-phosphate dehydratase HisB [Bacteroidota bacterium]
MKRLLILDRDGTIIVEPPDEQIDSLDKLTFLPYVITTLSRICREHDFELVMATNQDGLGTPSFPEASFYPAHTKMLEILRGEGIEFSNILIDRSLAHEGKPTRKPGIGMFTEYIDKARNGVYDIEHSIVIGDRITDVELARNLGAQAILLQDSLSKHHAILPYELETQSLLLRASSWLEIDAFFRTYACTKRRASVRRTTKETDVSIELVLEGNGIGDIHTGLGFFDHMLEQLARHSGCNLRVYVDGDLHIDEHHTIEDTALALGEAFAIALGDKRGIERYGYCLLPMDEALAEVEISFDHGAFAQQRIHAAIDWSGRNWLVWNADFRREKIGDVPTEMLYHFFKSFTDAAKCTLNIRADATNEHHKIESIFKAVARAIKMAVRRDAHNTSIPSTKGVL